jgi:drug/metabolite transporter (DMT)-like permease
MLSLLFGLIAALAWGLHDFLVRKVTQHGTAAPLLFVVMAAGALALAPLSILTGWQDMTPRAALIAMASGISFAGASLGLFRAFAIGPVRLVAPICGAFPMVTMGLALLQGRSITALEWIAVLAVIAGIALVARQSGDTTASPNRRAAILWAGLGALCFALTFHLGQIAAEAGGELPATLISRLVGLSLVTTYLLASRTGLAPTLPYLKTLGLMGLLDATALAAVLAAGSLPHPEYAAVASAIFGIITILLAWRFLHERMQPIQWLGVAVVFSGIATLAA